MPLRLGQPPRNLPVRCGCGKPGEEAHLLQCPLGGFVYARHNSLRDLFLSFAKGLYTMVEKEPKLKTMTDAEKQTYMDRYGLKELKENPRGDISIVGFINDHEHWYFDFRVWNHLACS